LSQWTCWNWLGQNDKMIFFMHVQIVYFFIRFIMLSSNERYLNGPCDMFVDLCVDWEFWENLLVWLNLGERVLTELWELRKEKDFKSIMGAKGKDRFLESSLSLCPTHFLNDYSGNGMVAWSQYLFVNIHRTSVLLKGNQGKF
jgi:hypothetical protein